jgi:polysaccharide biosynthesis transport protein
MEQEEEKTLKDYLQIARRRKYTIIIPMLALLLISVIITIVLPPLYRSQATILIEQQHIPSDLVKSTVISFADERIQQIQQKLMTIDNINKMIEKFNLYPKVFSMLRI